MSLVFDLWNLVYRYWTIPKLVIEAVINTVIAVLLLRIGRLPSIVVDTQNPLVDRAEMLGLANQVITQGLFWVGVWLLFMAGWIVYRAWQLTR